MVYKFTLLFLAWMVPRMYGHDVLANNKTIGDIFCNAVIHGQLDESGKPREIHDTTANGSSPAIIRCHVDLLEPDSSITYHKALKIIPTRVEPLGFETFRERNVSVSESYKITFRNVTSTDYEYSIYMFSQEMDYTIAICGVMPYTFPSCWAPTFTLIRYYNSSTEATATEDTTTTSTAETETTTEATETTTEATETTTEATETTTEGIYTTPETTASNSKPPSTTESTTQVSTSEQQTCTSPPIVLPNASPLIPAISSGTVVFAAIVAIMLLIIVILAMNVRRLSTDKRLLQAEYDQLSTQVNPTAEQSL